MKSNELIKSLAEHLSIEVDAHLPDYGDAEVMRKHRNKYEQL